MNINEALSNVMLKIKAISKSRENTQQSYKFRGIDDVMNELHTHFAENKIIILPHVVNIERHEKTTTKQTTYNGKSETKEQTIFYIIVTMEYSFVAEDGTHVESITAGEAMDYGDKATNKAMSAALKYALLQMFLIPTEESKDSENDTYEIIQKKIPYVSNPPVESYLTNVMGAQVDKVISEAQQQRLFAIATKENWSKIDTKAMLKSFGYEHSKDIKVKDYAKIINKLQFIED